MKKMVNYYRKVSKNTKIHLMLLILFCLIQIIVITKFYYVFGSNIDWMKQHSVFPDYFRNLFYQTGNLFPDFAPHLGAGQNIFYFAYYGLYNPIILFSYLLPFVPMNIYIMITSILCVISSIILFYYFLRKNNFSNNICFVTSMLFLFSSSFLFHSHRHIMFINYMPFLILALIGVWRYFEKSKSGLLIINISMMILTSYYYSIPGIVVICLYGLFYYLKLNQKFLIKDILKNFIFFLTRILIGVLLASILLLPLIYVIMNGRSTTLSTWNISLLIPHVDISYLMYGTYGVGLTSILWIGLIYSILYLSKPYRVIGIFTAILMMIPIFNYLLNGGLYLNGKVFIPFIPLFLFFIASTIQDIKNHRIRWKSLFLAIIVSAFLLIELSDKKIYFLLESAITLYLLYQFQKKQKYYYLIPIVIVSAVLSTINNQQDDLVTIEDWKQYNSYYSYDVQNYLNRDSIGIYRYQDDLSGANGINSSYSGLDYRTTLYSSTSNPNYWNSYYKTFNNNDIYRNHFMLAQTNNLFFQNFMGIRYLLTNTEAPYGYLPIKEYDNSILYENKNAYSIGFATAHILNQTEYERLSFIEKLLAYQKNVITTTSSHNEIVNNEYRTIKLNYSIEKQDNLEIKTQNSHYQITSKQNGHLVLKLDQPVIDKTIVLRFRMNAIPSCKSGDTSITINHVMNKLTCRSWKYYNGNETFDYVLSSNTSIEKLDIYFAKGNYDISDIEIYEIPNSYFDERNITTLEVDYTKTFDDSIEGKINILEDGYFIFTIPYDKGFIVTVDNQKIEFEQVNDTFIGFPISKGQHTVKLEFRAPYSSLGRLISIFSLGITVGIIVFEKKSFH